MNVIRPSEKLLKVNLALSKMPRTKLTAEQAREQVREHLEEARLEMLKIGRRDQVR